MTPSPASHYEAWVKSLPPARRRHLASLDNAHADLTAALYAGVDLRPVIRDVVSKISSEVDPTQKRDHDQYVAGRKCTLSDLIADPMFWPGPGHRDRIADAFLDIALDPGQPLLGLQSRFFVWPEIAEPNAWTAADSARLARALHETSGPDDFVWFGALVSRWVRRGAEGPLRAAATHATNPKFQKPFVFAMDYIAQDLSQDIILADSDAPPKGAVIRAAEEFLAALPPEVAEKSARDCASMVEGEVYDYTRQIDDIIPLLSPESALAVARVFDDGRPARNARVLLDAEALRSAQGASVLRSGALGRI